MMKPIESVKMQSLSGALGEYAAARYCAPLAFFMLMRAAGYLPKKIMPDMFCLELDKGHLRTQNEDWSRPSLTRLLRNKYNAPIVSWQLHGKANIELMKQSGYLQSQQEIDFFLHNVFGHSIKEIVQSGYPTIVTMEPGFGSEDNQNIHAVLLADWSDDSVTVFDPDARNNHTEFSADYVEAYISPNGAGSIVLPQAR